MGASEHGMDAERLSRITRAIEADVASGRSDGAEVLVARRGEIAFHEAVGFADRDTGRPAQVDDVYHLFSITKTLTAAAVLQAADRGHLQLHQPVREWIPEFGVKGKQRVTLANLLTHQGGMPVDLPPMNPADFGDNTKVALAVADQALVTTPGRIVSYSPIGAFAVLGEVLHRADPKRRPVRTILAEDLFAPLGMKSTSLSLRSDQQARRVPARWRDERPGIIPPAAIESINVMQNDAFEMPGGGALGTAADLFRFGEALRRGGELDGVRILSRPLLELALQNHTGDEVNHIFDGMCEARGWEPFPACLGLGFFLRGARFFPMPFGATASPSSFGGLGAGSTMYFVDPERELVFVCLCAGILEDSNNFERLARLADLALGSVTD